MTWDNGLNQLRAMVRSDVLADGLKLAPVGLDAEITRVTRDLAQDRQHDLTRARESREQFAGRGRSEAMNPVATAYLIGSGLAVVLFGLIAAFSS